MGQMVIFCIKIKDKAIKCHIKTDVLPAKIE